MLDPSAQTTARVSSWLVAAAVNQPNVNLIKRSQNMTSNVSSLEEAYTSKSMQHSSKCYISQV